ncbi:unnamed protein product [Miscanthus lutarioriparius]|uniref:Uncharacterized protein n=1 Tax=Miscanthus lutarioriparius TaxID=422564 RepID=A0A811RE44_9POAL|nr:unnamed protein product [Miscanthus lutarioriparius]
MAQPNKEPCKKEACDIQACLSKNMFDSREVCESYSVTSVMLMTRRGISNADILNLQNDALVAELFGTELNSIDVC